MLSHKFRLYLHPIQGVSHRTHLSHLVVEPSSIRGLAADFPLLKHLARCIINAFISAYAIQLLFSAFATFTLNCISCLRCSVIGFRMSIIYTLIPAIQEIQFYIFI